MTDGKKKDMAGQLIPILEAVAGLDPYSAKLIAHHAAALGSLSDQGRVFMWPFLRRAAREMGRFIAAGDGKYPDWFEEESELFFKQMKQMEKGEAIEDDDLN